MTGATPTRSSAERILIVKLSSLGDVIHALPVPGALRAAHPQARIAWAIERKWLPLIERHPDLDQIFTLDSFSFRRHPLRHSRDLRHDLARVRGFGATATLDLQGTLKSAAVTRASGAPLRAGFARAALREPLAGLAYNRRVAPTAPHIVEQMLELAAALGPLRHGITFPFPIPEAIRTEVAVWIQQNNIGDFAFFSPGGGWASKRWPSERYAALAEILEQQYGLAVVLNRGPGEQAQDDAFRRANEIRARLFSGDVLHLAAVLERARVVVGGDTGPLQLAAALQTPTVALFGPTDPARNGPYSTTTVVLRKPTDTSYRRRHTFSPAMLAIQPEEVAAACGKLLAAPRLTA